VGGVAQKVEKLKVRQNRVTLKALANVSPGFALKPWVQKCPRKLLVTLKAVARLRGQQTPTQLLQSCKESLEAFANPGFQSKRFHPTRAARVGTPAWAGIGERFQRY
jgi:hypothetical protein